jgi:hypothetical protein
MRPKNVRSRLFMSRIRTAELDYTPFARQSGYLHWGVQWRARTGPSSALMELSTQR